jgi:hypothetical protein
MKIKLDSAMNAGAADVLAALARELYERPGHRIMGVLELAHDRRTQPAADSDKEAEVVMRVAALELARGDQEHALREAMKALYLHRTAHGTLDEAGDVQLSDRTLELTAGMLHAHENARLKTVVEHWGRYARAVANSNQTLSVSELRHELGAVADALHNAVYGLATATD